MQLIWTLIERRTGEELGRFRYERGAKRTLEVLARHCPRSTFEIVTRLEK